MKSYKNFNRTRVSSSTKPESPNGGPANGHVRSAETRRSVLESGEDSGDPVPRVEESRPGESRYVDRDPSSEPRSNGDSHSRSLPGAKSTASLGDNSDSRKVAVATTQDSLTSDNTDESGSTAGRPSVRARALDQSASVEGAAKAERVDVSSDSRMTVTAIIPKDSPTFTMVRSVGSKGGGYDAYSGQRAWLETYKDTDIINTNNVSSAISKFESFCSNYSIHLLAKHKDLGKLLQQLGRSDLRAYSGMMNSVYDQIAGLSRIASYLVEQGGETAYKSRTLLSYSTSTLAAVGSGLRTWRGLAASVSPDGGWNSATLGSIVLASAINAFIFDDSLTSDGDGIRTALIRHALRNEAAEATERSSYSALLAEALRDYSVEIRDILITGLEKRLIIGLTEILATPSNIASSGRGMSQYIDEQLQFIKESLTSALTDSLSELIESGEIAGLTYTKDESLLKIEHPDAFLAFVVGVNPELPSALVADCVLRASILGLVDKPTLTISNSKITLLRSNDYVPSSLPECDIPSFIWLAGTLRKKNLEDVVEWFGRVRKLAKGDDDSRSSSTEGVDSWLASKRRLHQVEPHGNLIASLDSLYGVYNKLRERHARFLVVMDLCRDSLFEDVTRMTFDMSSDGVDQLFGRLLGILHNAGLDGQGVGEVRSATILSAWADSFGGEISRLCHSVLKAGAGEFGTAALLRDAVGLSTWVNVWNETEFGIVNPMSLSRETPLDYDPEDFTKSLLIGSGSYVVNASSALSLTPQKDIRSFIQELAHDYRLYKQGMLRKGLYPASVCGSLGSGSSLLSDQAIRQIYSGAGSSFVSRFDFPRRALEAYGKELSIISGTVGVAMAFFRQRLLIDLHIRATLIKMWLDSIDSTFAAGQRLRFYATEVAGTVNTFSYLEDLESSVKALLESLESELPLGVSDITSEGLLELYSDNELTKSYMSGDHIKILVSSWDVTGRVRENPFTIDDLRSALIALSDDDSYVWAKVSANLISSVLSQNSVSRYGAEAAGSHWDVRSSDLIPMAQLLIPGTESAQAELELYDDLLDESDLRDVGSHVATQLSAGAEAPIASRPISASIDLRSLNAIICRPLEFGASSDDLRPLNAAMRSLAPLLSGRGSRYILALIASSNGVDRSKLIIRPSVDAILRFSETRTHCPAISSLLLIAPCATATFFGVHHAQAISISKGDGPSDIRVVLNSVGLTGDERPSFREAERILAYIRMMSGSDQFPLRLKAEASSLLEGPDGGAMLPAALGSDADDPRYEVMLDSTGTAIHMRHATLRDVLELAPGFVRTGLTSDAYMYIWPADKLVTQPTALFVPTTTKPASRQLVDTVSLSPLSTESDLECRLVLAPNPLVTRVSYSQLGAQLINVLTSALLA